MWVVINKHQSQWRDILSARQELNTLHAVSETQHSHGKEGEEEVSGSQQQQHHYQAPEEGALPLLGCSSLGRTLTLNAEEQ